MRVDDMVRVLRAHLLSVMGEEDFDLVAGQDVETLDISTDHWTIQFESGSAFLAIDDEPAEAAQFASARRAVMSEQTERALAAADADLGGAISDALNASGDPFSLDFVAAMAALSRLNPPA
jgi:hypothetical protein